MNTLATASFYQVGLIADIADVKAVLALGTNQESWASVAANVARLQSGSKLGKSLFAFAGHNAINLGK